MLTVMFLDKLRASFAVEIGFLTEVRTEVNGSGHKMLVKVHWMDLQFPDFDEHFRISAPPLFAGRGSTY
jgi:hypothetical protein